MSMFTSASMHFRTVIVIIQHLDELFDYNQNAYRALLERCRALLWLRTMTLFMFLSPQFIINHPDAREVFIDCSNRTTLPVVALNEAYIHVQHRMSFRSKIRALQTLFFSKIFGNRPESERPRLIMLMATMPTDYLPQPLDNQIICGGFSCSWHTY